jgi:hypothetical protein
VETWLHVKRKEIIKKTISLSTTRHTATKGFDPLDLEQQIYERQRKEGCESMKSYLTHAWEGRALQRERRKGV